MCQNGCMNPDKVNPETILEYVKSYIDSNNIDIDSIKVDTNLVEYGLESIVILQLIASAEEKFGFKLSLDKLEEYNFEISAYTISNCLC